MTPRLIMWTAGATLCVAGLCGCGGSSSGSASSAPSTSASASATSGDDSTAAPYSDAEACAWLTKNEPDLSSDAVSAQAQLTIGLSSFFEDHGGLPNADGYALDAALARGCPALHASALKKAGIKSFGNL